MTRKHLQAFAVCSSMLLFGSAAHADNECSTTRLKGSYAFSAHGELLGIIDAGSVHALKTPIVIDGVAIQRFDGAGTFTRSDFLNTGGVPRGGQTTFNPNQKGTYSVNSDCTGTMEIRYDSGAVLNLQFVVGEQGEVIKAIISSETVPSFPAADDGTTCTTPSRTECQIGVQVGLEGSRVDEEERRHSH